MLSHKVYNSVGNLIIFTLLLPGKICPPLLQPLSLAPELIKFMLKRIFTTTAFFGFSLLLLACPQQKTSQKVDYNDAERKLRVAVNINELAYSSWNRIYESFGLLKKDERNRGSRTSDIG